MGYFRPPMPPTRPNPLLNATHQPTPTSLVDRLIWCGLVTFVALCTMLAGGCVVVLIGCAVLLWPVPCLVLTIITIATFRVVWRVTRGGTL